ncbi:MAG: tetratricopeptide repeat protein [Myxococcota bacterium]
MNARWLRAPLSVLLAALVAVGSPALALGPFEKNHPLVQEGLDAFERGDYEAALQKFEAAKKELPDSAAVEFNRGNALFKLQRFEEARDAYRRVAEIGQGQLRQKDHYNLGNALAATGENKEAISAYRRALVLDPKDELARHNLEVLLRKLPPKQQSGPDGGTPDGGGGDGGGPDGGAPDAGRDGGTDGGSDGGKPDGGEGDGGHEDGGEDGGGGQRGGDAGTDGGRDAGQSGEGTQPRDGGEEEENGESDAGMPEDADGGQDGGAFATADDASDGGLSEAELSRREAEKLLDAMKKNEKNLQLWRFQQKKRRRPVEKDW